METVLSYETLLQVSRAVGFDAVGVARAEKLSGDSFFLQQWIGEGCQAGMTYMTRNREKREDIRLLVENARSVIVTLTNYYTPVLQSPDVPQIARYAYGKDYHLVIKQRLKWLTERLGGVPGRCFTDSAPVFEHEWARRAGLGWIGKNTLLINKEMGSFCFIGLFVTPVLFDRYSEVWENNYCGHCRRCIEACPTGALSVHKVDARKCISYHTIESREACPEEIKKVADNRIFGCDRCQDVCPWNSRAKQHRVEEFLPHPEVMQLNREDWLTMDQTVFTHLFKDTPLERTGLEKIRSNLPEDC